MISDHVGDMFYSEQKSRISFASFPERKDPGCKV